MKKIYFLLFTLITTLSFGQIVINEIDADQTNTDSSEFIELKWTPNTALDGFVVVLYNGTNDLSYAAYDLDGKTTDANGFFILANTSLVSGGDIDLGASNIIQNGQDAVAIYQANGADFPTGTPVTSINLIDALVYDTDDPDDSGLLTGLGETIQYNENLNTSGITESIQRKADGTYGVKAPTFRAENNFTSGPEILVSGALTNIGYITGTGPSPEKLFTVEGSNLTADISITAPANFEISTTQGANFSGSLSLRQTAGSVSSTIIYTRLAAGLAIGSYSGNVTTSSAGATDKTVALSGGVYPALTNALVITGVFDGNATTSTPRGIELMVLKNIPDLSIFGVESANNGGGALGQEFTFPAVAATKGQTIFIVGTGHETDFTTYFGAGFTANYASDAMFINGNDAIVLYENTFMIDLFGEVTHAALTSPYTGLAWNYENGWGYRIAGSGPSATFNAADWQLGNAGELDQSTNGASSTPFPIKTYTNVLGISKQQLKDGFALYPNPVRGGMVSIQSKSNTVKNISIFDVVGKQVYQKTTSASQINISQLKTGMYFVKVVQDGKIATRKLVVQ